MCPHDSIPHNFKVIYFKGGVMLRQCENCERVEFHLERELSPQFREWVWTGVDEIRAALDFLQTNYS